MSIFNMGRGVVHNIDTEEGMADAVAWMNVNLSTFAEGGRWIVPRSGSIYEVSHSTKTVRRIMGLFDEPAIERVIKAAGWKFENKSAAN